LERLDLRCFGSFIKNPEGRIAGLEKVFGEFLGKVEDFDFCGEKAE